MTESQQKVLDWLRQQRKSGEWYRPSQMVIPDYAGGPTSIGVVLRALIEMGKAEVRWVDRGNGTQCREYRAVAGPEPHRRKKRELNIDD